MLETLSFSTEHTEIGWQGLSPYYIGAGEQVVASCAQYSSSGAEGEVSSMLSL